MNFKTHVIGGLSAGVIANDWMIHHTSSATDTAHILLLSSAFIAGSVLGSLLPDIDHRGSFIGRRAKIISTPLSMVASHRGITHTPLLLMALLSIMLFVSHSFLTGFASVLFSYLSIGIGIGIASHILLDSLTKGGVPLLYPLSNKKFSFLPLKTGGVFENVIALGIVVGTLLFMSGKYFV